MTGLCRYDAFVIVGAQLEGGEYSVDVCDAAASHIAYVRRTGDGLAVEVAVDVCPTHEHAISEARGYYRSIKKRART